MPPVLTLSRPLQATFIARPLITERPLRLTFPLALGSPFAKALLAALAPPAARLEEAFDGYLLFVNGLMGDILASLHTFVKRFVKMFGNPA